MKILIFAILIFLPIYGQKFVPKGGKPGPQPWPVNFEPYLVVDSEVFHQYPTEIAVRFRNTPPFNAYITYDWEIKDENGAVVYGVVPFGLYLAHASLSPAQRQVLLWLYSQSDRASRF
jgi:hypothetical protein